MRQPRVVVVLGCVLLAVAACGGGDEQAASSTTADPADVEFRVALVGDSVMEENLRPAIETALDGDDRVASRFVLQATLSREAAVELQWHRLQEEFDPDVVVMLVGYWETLSPAFQDDDNRAAYVEDVIERIGGLATANGADLLWIGMPSVRSADQTRDLDALNAMYAEQAEASWDIDFLDTGTHLNTPDGTFTEFLPGLSGVMERTRRLERGNLHLCPSGVIRVVRPVLEWIGTKYPVTFTAGWEGEDWREPPELVRPEECPVVR